MVIAVANTESREQLAELVAERSALEHVAMIVATGAPPTQIFESVIAEGGRLGPTDAAALSRYEADGTVTTIGVWSRSGGYTQVGTRHPLGSGTLVERILETGRPARVDSYLDSSGSLAEAARELGWRSSVGAPLVLEGRLWGVLAVGSTTEVPLPPDTDGRLAGFATLVATAIANAQSRSDLDLSRARIVAAADATRRRIERDLHDGAQQQLVTLALELRALQASIPPELTQRRAEISDVVDRLNDVSDGLREIALGIFPASLAEGGLGQALKTLARRAPIPVELNLPTLARLPKPVETAAYYVVSEALTNTAKYAKASVSRVVVEERNRVLCIAVRDDGLGGADPTRGSGLLGLKDRVEAIGGTISIDSPLGVGTSLRIELPLCDRGP